MPRDILSVAVVEYVCKHPVLVQKWVTWVMSTKLGPSLGRGTDILMIDDQAN